MTDENIYTGTEPDRSEQDRRPLPFDGTTNFSLLGWILDKLRIGTVSQAKVDLRLDEQMTASGPAPDAVSDA